MTNRYITLLLALFTIACVRAQDAPKLSYTTQRLQNKPPQVDGKLDDPCWSEGYWHTEFIQQIPNEAAAPSQRTAMKILYDDHDIYVAFRAWDTEPEKIDRRAGRRDAMNGDMIGVCFDSYFDHLSGFEFDLTAAGAKTDLILMSKFNFDANWDAVWDGKVGTEDSAWTAEMRIPFNQVRYSNKNDREIIWGLHAWRWINRLQEEDQFSLIRRNGPGHPYDMGFLKGLSHIPSSRHIEIMPYGVGQVTFEPQQAGNPFSKKHAASGDAGVDAKIGLASNVTMDVTVNPDFGQVEADPSTLNLTVYEEFYEEKRPFFLEGNTIFDYSLGGNPLFYSRRIGHAPAVAPSLAPNEYAHIPDTTPILGALKITGKSNSGWSFGVIESITPKVTAEIESPTGNSEQTVEPMTHYGILRVKKDMNNSNTTLGAIFTSANRRLDQNDLHILPNDAFTGGVDFRHYLSQKKSYIGVQLVGSRVTGDPLALLNLQQASSRYFQRPDADHLRLDSTQTALSGHGGLVEFKKDSYGPWRIHANVNWRSPGLELNDLGYMTTTDYIESELEIGYVVTEPRGLVRDYSLEIGALENRNFDIQHLYTAGYFAAEATLKNRWRTELVLNRINETHDTRLLRGGPAIYTKGLWCTNFEVQSDASKKLAYTLHLHNHFCDDGESKIRSFIPGIKYKVSDALQWSTSLNVAHEVEMLHYVGRLEQPGQPCHVLGKLDRKTLGITLRFDFVVTPDLTIQYYGNPYLSSGRYADFRQVTDTAARSYDRAFSQLPSVYDPNTSSYFIDVNQDGVMDQRLNNPDFSYREFRSNLVLRWEFSPGSTCYLVWTHDRSGYDPAQVDGYEHNWDKLWTSRARNIILAKLSYWFSM